MNMTPTSQKSLCNRLTRAEGQIRALRTMIEQQGTVECETFLVQVKAARAALKRASEQYILEHIHHCETLPAKERAAKVSSAISLLAGD